jgi:hypothetical protein
VSDHSPSTSCWICSAIADSAEHRIKKTDLVRAYGRGPYRGPSAPVHVRGGVITPVQGPGSARVKYEPSLCRKCNTTTTQPFDNAYDRFVTWVYSNEEAVLQSRVVDFEEIYGSTFEEGQRNLFKYFVKSFGCRLVESGQSVPQDLIALLSVESFTTALKISMVVNEDALLLPRPTRDRFIGKGALVASLKKSDPSIVHGYTWDEYFSWCTVFYWYAVEPEPNLGSPWIADAQHLRLGRVSPLSAEARAEFVSNVHQLPGG